MAASQPSLFSGLKLTIKALLSSKQYDIYILQFNPTQRFVIDICSYTNGVPIFQLIGHGRETYISYGLADDQETYDVLCSLLQILSLSPPSKPFSPVAVSILIKEPYTLKKPLMFRTPHATHKVVLNPLANSYNFLVKIEGTNGASCVEIFIKKKTLSLVAQIYSEEDCSHDGTLMDGATVDMIKGSLQICFVFFGITQFELNDESNIECDTTPVPRKRIKPLSLAQLTIIKYGQTWYERNFQAYLKNESDRIAYTKGLENLNKPITMSFNDFSEYISLYPEQEVALKPFYTTSSTWSEFLKKIPKEKHCELLYWAPEFINRLMKFNVRYPLWVIDLEKMTNTTVLIFTNNVSCRLQGGAGRRKTRSRRKTTRKQKPLFVFSNKFGGNILRL